LDVDKKNENALVVKALSDSIEILAVFVDQKFKKIFG